MLLITESNFESVEVLVESNGEGGGKNYYLEGPFMQGRVKNRNGRIYPTEVLEKEMNRYLKTHVKENRALGELGHPSGPQINADRVCHYIVDMYREGDNFIGKAKVMDTPMGKILKNFIDEGIKTGVSTRGLGTVKETRNGIMEVQSDFYLAAIDSVTDPSGPDCFVKGIMENTEYYFDISLGSWVKSNSQQVVEETTQDAEIKASTIIENNFVALEDFNEAMKRLEILESTIRALKEGYVSKPDRSRVNVDESTALHIFESFISTLKK
jgi:hypothetical protein